MPRLLAMALGFIALTACGGTATKTPSSADRHHNTVIGDVWNPGYGWIVVGPNDHALYMFCVERPPHCPIGHDPNYAPLIAHGAVIAAPAAKKPGGGEPVQIAVSKLGTVRLNNRERQVTYFGHRLYSNRNDHEPGDINGEHYVKQEHGLWTLVYAGAGQIALPTSY